MKISEYIFLNEYCLKLFYMCKYRIFKNVLNIIYKNLCRSDCECIFCNVFFCLKKDEFLFLFYIFFYYDFYVFYFWYIEGNKWFIKV